MNVAGNLVVLAGGLVLLAFGAELLVRGASRLAAAAGVSPLVVGLTVVAFATSAPELTVSVQSAWIGSSDLALGNVVGSNIFNVLFILGMSALVTPLVVASQVVRREVPIVIGASAAVLVMAADGQIARAEAALLVSGVVVYTWVSIVLSRRESAEVRKEFESSSRLSARGAATNAAFVVVGLALLVYGTQLVVNSAVEIARSAGIPELVIGLTLVAGGTSLPELATSVLAAIRGERDIAVGNVVGSSIFNILAILGVSALLVPITVSDAARWFDIPVMIAVSFAMLPIALSGSRITRLEGLCLLASYAAYATYLGLDAAEHEQLPAYRVAILTVLMPLAGIGVIETVRLVGAAREGQPSPP